MSIEEQIEALDGLIWEECYKPELDQQIIDQLYAEIRELEKVLANLEGGKE